MIFLKKNQPHTQRRSSILIKTILIIFIITSIISITVYLKNKNNNSLKLISESEITILQCRKLEKNFLLRHDQTSVDDFKQKIKDLKKQAEYLKGNTKDKTILALFEDIEIDIENYKKAFQDICGLYNSAEFGPVNDIALSKITDEVTLLAEPEIAPSPKDSNRSLIEAARKLEYFINTSSDNSTALICMLQARRWEKNYLERNDKLTSSIDSKSMYYAKKTRHEIAKLKEWLLSEEKKNKKDLYSKIKTSLDQYEQNYNHLTNNIDAYYIKKREMLRAARNISKSLQFIKDSLTNKTSESTIDGIYYLSPRLPTHGQPHGNYHDVGSLVKNQPVGSGYRHCKNWMQFYFDQDGNYLEEYPVYSIYFHIWIRTANKSIDFGYEKKGAYSGGRGAIDDFITIEYDDSKAYSEKSGSSLITGKIDMDGVINGNDIYNFAIKLSRHSGFPFMMIEPGQYSFIIINPSSDRILKLTDTDEDGLNDYQEMYVYHTNPYDEDTDKDGLNDKIETAKGTPPNISNLYTGEIIKGFSRTPHITNHEYIDKDWLIDNKQTFKNGKFTLDGSITIQNGGYLMFDNCIIEMNKEDTGKKILVDKNGTLILKKTELIFNKPGYWYNIMQSKESEIHSNFDISGKVIIDKSELRNSLGIKIFNGSNVKIKNSRIINSSHISFDGRSEARISHSYISTFIGISVYCKQASPLIENSVLNVEYAGIGMYCFSSSPTITDSKIIVCEDEDSEALAFALYENSSPVLTNTYYNKKRVKRDKTSIIVYADR